MSLNYVVFQNVFGLVSELGAIGQERPKNTPLFTVQSEEAGAQTAKQKRAHTQNECHERKGLVLVLYKYRDFALSISISKYIFFVQV